MSIYIVDVLRMLILFSEDQIINQIIHRLIATIVNPKRLCISCFLFNLCTSHLYPRGRGMAGLLTFHFLKPG